jgi:hypothetical protein
MMVRSGTASSASGDGTHRIQANDDWRARIEGQLVADLPAAEQLTEQTALAGRQSDEDVGPVDLDGGHVVIGAVDPETPPQLVHRHVGPALDEATELRRRTTSRPVDLAAVVARRLGSVVAV